MRNTVTENMVKLGVAAAALLVLAAQSPAQRSRSNADKTDDSRPAARTDSRPAARTESRPAPTAERPIFRGPASAPDRGSFTRPETRENPRWTPSQRDTSRMPSPQPRVQADNPSSLRGSRSDRTPDNGGTVRSPSPRNDPAWRDNRPSAPADETRSQRSPSTDRRPDAGRVRPTEAPGTPGDVRRGGRTGDTPSTGSVGRRSGSTADAQPGPPTRSMGRRGGAVGTDTAASPSGWRPPSRSAGSRPGTTGTRDYGTPGSGAVSRSGGVGRRDVPTGPGYRPPVVNRNNWEDGGRHYAGQHFQTIDLGWYDPWYHYNWGIYSGETFYYPYYYCGPYINGYHYSPFWCYGSWAPIYIYPERIIYVEKRVYLHDVVDDDYDLYDTRMQSSMRDTLDDIKAAWLDGEGGRLLDHVNQGMAIRIYQKGQYKYSLQPDDFRDVTKDALNRIETTGFEWTNVDKVSTEEVHLEARHTFRDPDGEKHVIRLTYTLEKARGGWWITEAGTEKWADEI